MHKESLKTEDIVRKLNPLFQDMINGNTRTRSEEESKLCKILFSRNVLFLRTYLGLFISGAPYDQVEYASLLGVSAAGLRRWEAGEVIPNELSLRAISSHANQVLQTPMPIENAHLLYRSLVNELTLLRLGSHNYTFQNLSSEQQRQFASFVNNNMDQVLDYFLNQIHETQINYQVLLENALVGIYVFDKEGKIIYSNEAIRKMSGYSEAEISSINFESIVHPDDLEDSRKRIKERLTGEVPKEHYTFRFRNKSGQYGTYEVFSSRILNKGEPQILGVVQDITQRLETEKALKESEEKYRSLFSSMSDAFALHEVITDDQGKPVNYRYLDINPAFEKMTGLNAPEVIGKTVLDVSPNVEDYGIEAFGNVAITGKPVKIHEYSRELNKHFEAHGYCPKTGQFAVTFFEVTDKENEK